MLHVTARHLFLETFFSNDGGYGQTILERSDDGGQTWQRADHGLENVGIQWYAQPLDSSGESLVALIQHFDNPGFDNRGQIQSDLWMTRDAGATWRHIDPAASDTLTANYEIGFLLTGVGGGVTSDSCHCAFGAAYPNGNSPFASQQIYRRPIHPLDATAADADKGHERTAFWRLSDAGHDRRWQAAGAGSRSSGGCSPALTKNNNNGWVSSTPPALWAWNSRTGRWDVASTHIPCEDLQTCYVYSPGATAAIGAGGKVAGTWFWISATVNTDQNAPPTQAYYRVYIPAT